MKRIMKKVLLVVCALILVFAAAFGFYLSNDRPADQIAVEAFQKPAAGVNAVNENGRMVFSPEEKTDRAVIFYPGAKVRYEAYAPLAEKLAENGIMCILVDMPLNLSVLNQDEAENVKNEYPEISHWYLGGHSMGGLAAEGCAADHMDGYDGLIVLASRIKQDFSDNDLPVLLVSATNDGICSPELLEKEKTPLPKNLTHVVIEGGCHGNFGSYGVQPHDGIPEISWEDQQDQTITTIMNWIDE